ncbi:MAG: GGDEF domain-containing protein [Gammaproteobacteria bacterium]|nr:GGDEF domain-containing protein [Gammaproteobacteria bacterium]
MNNDGFEQLSAVIGLSRERDGVSLTRALTHTLRALCPGVDVAVLEVYGHRPMAMGGGEIAAEDVSVRRFDETGHRVDRRECIDDVAGFIASLRPSAVDCEGRGVGQVVVPVSGDIGPLRLVVLDDVPIDPWVRSKLMQVVEVYGNLIRLMDSRERDSLTGLLNRQTFASLFELAVQRSTAGGGTELVLAVLDIDRFKKINDTFGHLYGDEVLIHFAHLMERAFRYTDDLFRFGGEEFLVLLSGADGDSGRIALERFRKLVEGYDFPGVGRVTVSVGYVGCGSGVLPTTLIDRADQALYFAKDSGRNQVVNFADIDEPAHDESGSVQLF